MAKELTILLFGISLFDMEKSKWVPNDQGIDQYFVNAKEISRLKCMAISVEELLRYLFSESFLFFLLNKSFGNSLFCSHYFDCNS